MLGQTGICSRDSSNVIEEYITSVIGFINKCIDDVIPTVTICTYPNQKPWITGNIHIELKARAATFKEQDTNLEAYKTSHYALRRTIKQAKSQYRIKIECHYTGSDACWMWQGLKTITDYKGKPSRELPSDVNLPDELNDYRPIVVMSVAMKCFERLVMDHINGIIPDTLDTLLFAYGPNRCTDAISNRSPHCPFPPG